MNSRRFSWSNCICRPSQGLPWQHTALARIKLGLIAVQDFDPAHDRSGSKTGKARSEHIQSGLLPGADIAAAFRLFRKVPRAVIGQRH